MSQKAIRITALVLALIMAGGVLIVAFSNIAGAVDLSASPATGTEGVPKAPIIVGVVAVLLIVGCVAVPKIAKK